ncbi:MAG: bifunctional class I SAM-dependent methyltransferase/glycosyltransferase family 2 protein [Pseudomonadota bacterium]
MLSKQEKIKFWDAQVMERDLWLVKNSYYNNEIEVLVKSMVPVSKKVLEVGSGTGDLLNSTRPSEGTGIDFSPEMIKRAREKYPDLNFELDDIENLKHGKKYDYVILSNLIGDLSDIGTAFRNLNKVTRVDSRLIVVYYNYLWEPLIKLAEKLNLKSKQEDQNWLSLTDIENLLVLNGYESIKKGYRLLLPKKIPFLSYFVNNIIAKIPFIRRLCLIQYVVVKETANKTQKNAENKYSCSVVVPCRNEMGNIEDAVNRIPKMGKHTEIIFVDGASTDGTVEKIEEMIEKFSQTKDIRLIHQVPRKGRHAKKEDVLAELNRDPDKMLSLGKADATRKGFDAATGDVLMILDADLTVPPEDLPKFFTAIVESHGEFINGTRLVYQMEKEAMRLFNILGNKFFSMMFTWILEQSIKDTLCGTKVLTKKNYLKIKENRAYFGDFDPFGDFELLLGAAKLNLKIVEIPIRYQSRTYGNIKIERFKHGLLLLKMCWIGFKKLKLV